MKKLVSVVIPSFNHGHFIEKTIQSVLDQTYKNWELIIVDNNSNDNTNEIIKNFNNDKIKLFKINNNGIIALSRNKGIFESRGGLISFLDSDDWWYKKKLELSVNAINKGFDIVCHAEDWIKDKKIVKSVTYGPAKYASYKKLLYKKNCLSTSAVTVKKDCLMKVGGFCEDYNAVGVEDYHLWIKLSRNNFNFTFLGETLGAYRVYSNSYSSDFFRQLKAEIWVINDHHNDKPSIINVILKYKRFLLIYLKSVLKIFKFF